MPTQRSNCYIQAWRAYATGDAVWMACRQSRYSKMFGRMPLVARLLGAMLLWASTGVWLAGHYLRFGTWPHWIYCRDIDGDCMEAVPASGGKFDRLFPPALFAIRVQKLNGKRDESDE